MLYITIPPTKMPQESTPNHMKAIEQHSRMSSPPKDFPAVPKKPKKAKKKARIDKDTKPEPKPGVESQMGIDTNIPDSAVPHENLRNPSSEDDDSRIQYTIAKRAPANSNYFDNQLSAASTTPWQQAQSEELISSERIDINLFEGSDTTSEESQQQFYTPEELSPQQQQQQHQTSPPTTPERRISEKESSQLPFKTRLLAEKVGLDEENDEWETTPEKERPSKLSYLGKILASLDTKIQPDLEIDKASNGEKLDNNISKVDGGSEKVSVDLLFQHQAEPLNINEDVCSYSPIDPVDSSALTLKGRNKEWPPKSQICHDKVSKGERRGKQSKQQSVATVPDTHSLKHSTSRTLSLDRQHAADGFISAPKERTKRPVMSLRSGKNLLQDSSYTSITRLLGESHCIRDSSVPNMKDLTATQWDYQHNDRDGTTASHGPTARPIKEAVFGPRGLAWAYKSHTIADTQMRDAGIWLWEQPETYYEPSTPRTITMDGEAIVAPAIVEQTVTYKSSEPQMIFDGRMLRIIPHFPPWQDLRSDVAHPDFLPSFKLAEYQACEVSGYQVWRHDRDSIACAWNDCRKPTSDFSIETRICIGCGPKSSVRYCCHQHEVKDLKNHWEVCGKRETILERIIDHTTAPDYFYNLCPVIKERHGIRSFALHRQQHFSCHCHGHYTLFDPVSEKPITLTWPKTDSKWQEMDARIERLLNIAFLDVWKHSTLRYLYGLLRQLISITPLDSTIYLHVLKRQFGAEFGAHIFRTTDEDPIFRCDCEWYGSQLDPIMHLQSCPQRRAGFAVWPEYKGQGLLRKVADMEARYWILRAWAQQHPVFQGWRERAEGLGFEEGLDKAVVRLGPGFIGWGAETDNIWG